MSIEGVTFRIPNDEKLDKDFDAAVVIPSYDEGYGILDAILNATRQKPLKNGKAKHCVVVVINNDKTTSLEKKRNNLLTYLLLQALVHKQNVAKRGDNSVAEKARLIQESNVPLLVVDAFSDGFANEGNNVGLARRIGHDVAAPHVKDDGFYVSSDADARISPWAVSATKLFFEYAQKQDPAYAGITYGLYTHMDGTTEQEKRTSRVNDIFRNLRTLISTDSHIERSMVWMSGGGAAYLKKGYQEVGGHPKIPGEEDTKLGIALADKGFKVVNAFRNSFVPKELARYMVAAARGRVSDRASTGMGRGIAKRDEAVLPFKDQSVESFLFSKHSEAFFKKFEDAYWDEFVAWLEAHPEISGNYEESFLYTEQSQSDPVVNQFYEDSWSKICEKMESIFEEEGVDITSSEYTEEYQKFISAVQSYRPSMPNSSNHHELYWSVHKIFKIRFKDEPVSAAVAEYAQEIDGAIKKKLDEYSEARAMLRESSFFSAETFTQFADNVVHELPKSVVTLLADQNVRCKFDIMLLTAFTRYTRAIEKVVELCEVRKELREIKEKRPDKKVAIWMREGQDTPDELAQAQLHAEYLAALSYSVGYLRFAMEYEWDENTLALLTDTSNILEKRRTDFVHTVLNPIVEKHREQLQLASASFKNLLKVADDKDW